jgi:hypothetical protein
MDTYARPAEGAKNQKPKPKQIKRSQPSAAPTGDCVGRWVGCQPAFASEQKAQPITHVGAAAGCDLLILLLKDKVKGSHRKVCCHREQALLLRRTTAKRAPLLPFTTQQDER